MHQTMKIIVAATALADGRREERSSKTLTRKLVALTAIGVSASALTFAARAGASLPTTDAAAPPPTVAVLTGRPDLVVSGTTASTATISNRGRSAAGPFSVGISKGYAHAVGCDEYSHWVAPVTTRIKSLVAGGSVTIRFEVSTTDRVVTADTLNEVAEASELNNSGIVSGEPIIC
jgi:hypothetical protein